MSGTVPAELRQRIDKWLWFARLTKSRTQAQAVVASGAVRINRQKIDNASHAVRVGDTLTVAVHARVLVLRVLKPGERRGPATEARLLYEEVAPPVILTASLPSPAAPAGRPDKRGRRAIIAMRRQALDEG